MARMLPPDGTPIPWDTIQSIIAAFRKLREETGMSLQVCARKLGEGFSVSVLSTFSSLTRCEDFVGDLDRVARGINRFVETEVLRREIPPPAGYVETEVARRMLTLIRHTIRMRSIGLIYSDAGRGKTMTLEAALAIHPGAVLIRVLRSTRRANPLCRHLAQALKLPAAGRAGDVEARVIQALRGTDRLLMIDEAHQLEMDGLELLRDLYDECRMPLVLAGTHQISDKVSDATAFFGQFNRRIGMRYDVTEPLRGGNGDNGSDSAPRPLHSVEEIRSMFERDKFRLADDAAVMLARIANSLGQGGLGIPARICEVALGVVKPDAASGVRTLTARLIQQIYRQLHGRTYAARGLESAIADLRVAIA